MKQNIDNLYCGAIKQGDVLLCKYEDTQKHIVVLQDSLLNGSMPTVVGALLDLEKNDNENFVNEVCLTEEDLWKGASGVCMLHKIVTVERKTVYEKKGSLQNKNLKKVYSALDINLGKFRDFKF
tara:strand:- start:111 stop:482 length:372 start_codon:yes stop_codon:yes gene_type:complete